MSSKGFKWGFAIFNKNYEDYGETGIKMSDKARETCVKYANDKSIKKTKSGKVLDDKTRKQYKEIAKGMSSAYNKLRW